MANAADDSDLTNELDLSAPPEDVGEGVVVPDQKTVGSTGVDRPTQRASVAHLRQQAQRWTQTAVGVLVEVATDQSQPGAARVTAATALLDRGWGRPEQSHKLEAGASFIQLLQQMQQLNQSRMLEARAQVARVIEQEDAERDDAERDDD